MNKFERYQTAGNCSLKQIKPKVTTQTIKVLLLIPLIWGRLSVEPFHAKMYYVITKLSDRQSEKWLSGKACQQKNVYTL